MAAVSARGLVVVHVRVLTVGMLVHMFVQVFVGVEVLMFVQVGHIGMRMFVGMRMLVLMTMQVLAFMRALHTASFQHRCRW